MIKNKLIALAAAATVAGLAAPAFAASSVNNNDDTENGWSQFTQYSVLASLQQRGVDATSVEQWGPYLRAYVQNPDGTVQQKFFDPDTFAPANPANLSGA
jgi:hypothetical protein